MIMCEDIAAQQRDEGMARAEASARENWCDSAVAFVVDYCRTHDDVFCDDLWAAGLPMPTSPRALGPVMQKVAALGVMVPTGLWRKSINSNLSVKPVWRVVRA